MKIRTIIGLAAIGGFIYAHTRRGGQLTLESFRQTALELLGQAKSEAGELKERAGKAGKKVVHEVSAAGNAAESRRPASS
jgi:hypothetical protein